MKQPLTLLIILAIITLLTACREATVAGSGEVETATPQATATPTTGAEKSTFTSPVLVVTAMKMVTPTVTATNTPIPAQEQNVLAPTPTPRPAISLVPLLGDLPNFYLTEAEPKTDASGNPHLSLPITLNQAKIGEPVQELVYLITNPLDDQLAETTIWRANVNDISNSTAIITMQHQILSTGANNPSLSPNGKYIVYGTEYDDRTHTQWGWLLNINDGTQEVITRDAQIQNNSQTYLWSKDSESILYTTASMDWTFSEVKQYALETGETKVLFSDNEFINFVGWSEQFIYYIPRQATSLHTVKFFDVATGQVHKATSIEGDYVTSNIRISSDGTRVLFNYLLVDLLTKDQARLSASSQVLWFPDGQGLLGGNPLSALHFNGASQPSADDVILTLKLPLGLESEQIISWSPDGQYLVYRAKSNTNQSVKFLHNLHSGQTQQFPTANAFKIGGWIVE